MAESVDPAAPAPDGSAVATVDPDTHPGLHSALSDPAYRDAVVDLLAVVSYGEMVAFERLAEDAKLAPSLQDTLALARMAAAQLDKVQALHERLVMLGVDPFAAMAPFRVPIDSFHRHTAPSDWLEGLVKAYVGDGLANDFYREIAAFLDPDTRDLVLSSLDDGGEHAHVLEAGSIHRPQHRTLAYFCYAAIYVHAVLGAAHSAGMDLVTLLLVSMMEASS